MLSRYEELITQSFDNHGRFPATASVAYKESFLDRPIINEYLEIFKDSLLLMWPNLNFTKHDRKNFITCDVDWPYDPTLYSLKQLFKKLAKSIIFDKEISSVLKRVCLFLNSKARKKNKDSYHQGIKFIMDMNEKYNNKVAFYFISHHTSKLDTLNDSEFDSQRIRSLLREIKNRGHELGVHPGYNTFNNSKNFKKTVERFRKILKEEKINQRDIGGRQHFLRWDTSQTPKLWEANNLLYDSTLSYADKSGFRCGICYEFTMYDLIERRPLNLKQRPLIVMECSIISKNYEGLGYKKESIERFEYLKKRCHQFDGTFTLLWHNYHFQNKEDKIFYEKLIK
jgi:peptidoglycan/xylan/chitin deacetylase (PgdA/CDA1 family)